MAETYQKIDATHVEVTKEVKEVWALETLQKMRDDVVARHQLRVQTYNDELARIDKLISEIQK